MCGLFVRGRGGGIDEGLVQNELRRVILRLQYVEAAITRLAPGRRAVGGGGSDELVDMRGFDVDMNQCDVHRVDFAWVALG